MFLRSRNPLLIFLQSNHVCVTSKIQVDFRFNTYSKVLVIVSCRVLKFLHYLCFWGQGIFCWHSYWATMFGGPLKIRSPSGSRGFRSYPNNRSSAKMLWIYKQSRKNTRDGHTTNAILSTLKSCHVMSRHATSCHVMSSHFTSCHVMSRPVASCHVMSRHVTSWHVMSRHVTSCHAMPRHVTSRHVMSSYHVMLRDGMWCDVMPRHATSNHVMPRHVTSCHVMSRHVTSRHVTSCHVMSHHATSWHVMSHHVTSCHSCHVMPRHVTLCNAMSRLVTSCHVTSCHVMSRHVTSCHVMSRLVTSCHVVSRHATSLHVTSCHVMSRWLSRRVPIPYRISGIYLVIYYLINFLLIYHHIVILFISYTYFSDLKSSLKSCFCCQNLCLAFPWNFILLFIVFGKNFKFENHWGKHLKAAYLGMLNLW